MKENTPREKLTQLVIDHPEICDQLLTHLSALDIYPTLNDENKRRFEARMMEIAKAEGVL